LLQQNEFLSKGRRCGGSLVRLSKTAVPLIKHAAPSPSTLGHPPLLSSPPKGTEKSERCDGVTGAAEGTLRPPPSPLPGGISSEEYPALQTGEQSP
jgi:hypothetical protein